MKQFSDPIDLIVWVCDLLRAVSETLAHTGVFWTPPDPKSVMLLFMWLEISQSLLNRRSCVSGSRHVQRPFSLLGPLLVCSWHELVSACNRNTECEEDKQGFLSCGWVSRCFHQVVRHRVSQKEKGGWGLLLTALLEFSDTSANNILKVD